MRRIRADERAQLRIQFEGEMLLAREGDTVAAALLAAGRWRFRTTAVSSSARGPFCMMGACFDCLVEIDGVADRQACMTEVRDGMRVKRQSGASDSMGDPLAGTTQAGSP
jgi:predicted molibdopterin-dependent oxidoreductase YjgC